MVQDPASALDRNLTVNGYQNHHHNKRLSSAACARREDKQLELLSLQAIDYFPPSPPPSPTSYMIRTDSISSISCDSVSLCSSSTISPRCIPLSATSMLSSSSSILDSALLYEQLSRHPSYCPILPSPRRIKAADMFKVCFVIQLLTPSIHFSLAIAIHHKNKTCLFWGFLFFFSFFSRFM